MQFEGQRPKRERRSREAMLGGSGGMPPPPPWENFENTGLKEGISEPPDAI